MLAVAMVVNMAKVPPGARRRGFDRYIPTQRQPAEDAQSIA